MLRKNYLDFALSTYYVFFSAVLYFLYFVFPPYTDQNDQRARTRSSLSLFSHTDAVPLGAYAVKICCN